MFERARSTQAFANASSQPRLRATWATREALFKESGGKEIAELWQDFVATLQKK